MRALGAKQAELEAEWSVKHAYERRQWEEALAEVEARRAEAEVEARRAKEEERRTQERLAFSETSEFESARLRAEVNDKTSQLLTVEGKLMAAERELGRLGREIEVQREATLKLASTCRLMESDRVEEGVERERAVQREERLLLEKDRIRIEMEANDASPSNYSTYVHIW